jgi:hypothetical protein
MLTDMQFAMLEQCRQMGKTPPRDPRRKIESLSDSFKIPPSGAGCASEQWRVFLIDEVLHGQTLPSP